MKDRRLKMIRVGQTDVIGIFTMPAGEHVPRLVFPDLPVGYQVIAAYYSFQYMGWDVIVQHESFPEVTIGKQIPEIASRREVVRIHNGEQFKMNGNDRPSIKGIFVEKPEEFPVLKHVSTLEFDKSIVVNNGETVAIKPTDLVGKFIVEHRNSDGILLSTTTAENKIVHGGKNATLDVLDNKSNVIWPSDESIIPKAERLREINSQTSQGNNPFDKDWTV